VGPTASAAPYFADLGKDNVVWERRLGDGSISMCWNLETGGRGVLFTRLGFDATWGNGRRIRVVRMARRIAQASGRRVEP